MQPTIRDFKLARVFLNHSLHLKPKEKLMINVSDSGAFSLAKAVYIEALKLGVYPVVDTQVSTPSNRSNIGGFAYQFYRLANKWQLNYIPHELLDAKSKWADAYITIVTIDNSKELNQIPQEKILLRSRLTRPYSDRIIDRDRWLLTYYPTPSMAQEAGVSFDWLLDFYYQACLVDYAKMKKNLLKIEKVLDKGKKVRITGEKTELTFSIEERLAKAAYGERNIPDGEVFIAPVHQTIKGHVYFDLPSSYNGTEVEGIYLEFDQGYIVKARAEKGNPALHKILNTDKGAKSIGELGIGTNYQIKNAMKNTLFDEKIGGTIHLAIGRSYKEERGGAPTNPNESVIHWDIVKDMRRKGSVLFVDDKPLLKDGKFIVR
jgi:aminopeptidase